MASLGTINGKLHISIGDGEPTEVAEFRIPLIAHAPLGYHDISIQVDGTIMKQHVAAALHEVARHLEGKE